MAGKMQVAAKLFLGASLLATTGGGAYYYTANGFALPNFSQAKPETSTAELDAVASAWAELPAKPASDPALSSPIARSAKPEVSELLKKAATDTVDRYAVTTPSAANSSATEASVATTSISSAEIPNADAPVVAPVETQSTTETRPTTNETSAPEPTLATTETPAGPTPTSDKSESQNTGPATNVSTQPDKSVTRGQEPKEDAAASISEPSSDIGAAFAAATESGTAPSEPKQLTPPAQPTKIGDANSLAKKAFAGTPPPSGGDRYGNATPPKPEPSLTSPEGSVANPFSAAGAPAAPANTKTGQLEPLPQSPAGNSLPSATAARSSSGLRPLEGTSTASLLNRELPASSPSAKLPPLQVSPDISGSESGNTSPYNRSLPSSNELSPSNEVTPIAGEGTGKPGEKALEGPQQPTLVIQKFAPGEIQVGKPAKFVVQVRNVGAQSADGVTIRDEVPQGTKLVSTSPNATTEGNFLVWQIGKLSPGEDRKVEMQLMPTTEGDIGSVATVSYSAQASVKTRCTMPQLAIRMTAPGEVMVGSQQHVKIEIRNPGSGDATGVMLFENVPPNVKHAAGPALEFEIGTLHPNETRELDLVLSAEKAGKVVNTLTAKADGNLQVQQQVEFEVIAPALSVSLNGPERRYLERPATYEVSIENPGTAPAHDVQIVTKLPKGMRFVRANNMGEYDPATHAVYWSLAELPKGERGSVELVAMPTETGPQTLQVEGHAQQGLADHKQREIVIEGLAAIMFEVRDLEDPIEVGGETGYEIRVVNQGTKAAANVQVAIDLPPGLKLISAEGESAHKAQDGRVLFEPIQQLAPKADTVFRLRAQGLQAGDQRINVQVNTDDLQQPIRREESTRVFGDQ